MFLMLLIPTFLTCFNMNSSLMPARVILSFNIFPLVIMIIGRVAGSLVNFKSLAVSGAKGARGTTVIVPFVCKITYRSSSRLKYPALCKPSLKSLKFILTF